jgi:hypothetical protein
MYIFRNRPTKFNQHPLNRRETKTDLPMTEESLYLLIGAFNAL